MKLDVSTQVVSMPCYIRAKLNLVRHDFSTTFETGFSYQLEIVFTIAAPAFDILFFGCVLNTKIAFTIAEKLTFEGFSVDLLMLQDATRRW